MIARATFVAIAAVALATACGKNTSGIDAGPNVVDANPNAPDGSPGAPDAGVGPDAAVGVACGQMFCAPGTDCCIQQSGSSCVTSGTCTGMTIACDGKEDCPASGQVCCFGQNGGSSCTDGAGCSNPTCTTADDCPTGSPMCCPIAGIMVCSQQCF
jgi:hypothetical protein